MSMVGTPWSSSFTGMRCASFTSRCRRAAGSEVLPGGSPSEAFLKQGRRDDARATTEGKTTLKVKDCASGWHVGALYVQP